MSAPFSDVIANASLSRDSTVDDVRQHYKTFAEDYDKVLSVDDGVWEGPSRLTDAFNAIIESANKDLKIIDLGCGTGIIGSLLFKRYGFTNIDGLDLSEEMLEKAKEKKVYKNLICEVVTAKRLDIPTGTYDALIGAGAITSGHIKPDAMDEIVRLVKPGGYIAFTIRKDVYDKDDYYGYHTKFKELEDKKKWRFVKKSLEDYVVNLGMDFQKECYICVFQVVEN